MRLRFMVAAALLVGPACSKKDDGPPKMTKEALDQMQANSRANSRPLPGPAAGGPAAPVPTGTPDGLPTAPLARVLAVDPPLALAPSLDSQDVNQAAAYKLGDDIRFEVRVSGFTLRDGAADFDFEWSITDSEQRKIVGDKKRVQRPFKPEGAYVAIITHHPVALSGGSYVIHAKATDNLSSYLSRDASSTITYGAPSLKASTASGELQIRNFKLDGIPLATQKVSFDFVLVGPLVDATGTIDASVDVTLHPTAPLGPDRVLPTQKLVGKATAEGAFPVTVNLEAVAAGAYQIRVHATDNPTKRTTDDNEVLVVRQTPPGPETGARPLSP